MELEVLNATEFIETEPEKKDMPIGGLLDRAGLGFLFGPPKVGKSMFADNLVIVASRGGFFLDTFPIPKPLRVLLLVGEGSKRAIRNRFLRMTSVLGMPKDDNLKLVFNRRLRLDNESHILELLDFMKADKTELLVIDPMFRFHTGSEVEGKDMNRFLNGIGMIQDETGAAVIIVHHTVKNRKKKSGGELLRGHGSLFAAGDVYISFEKVKNGVRKVRLDFDCKDAEIEPMEAQFDTNFVFYGQGIDSVSVSDLVNILRAQGGRIMQADMIDIATRRFNFGDRTVRSALKRAKEIGVIGEKALPGRGEPKELYLAEMEECTGDSTIQPEETPSEPEETFVDFS